MTFFKNLPASDKKVTGNESGQSILLISVVILSFLLFFQFAINTGILVIAKISLQNAADAAAYAGAATQARQLNGISYLNYDMRQQYKKFLYRYVFVSSIGNVGFPGAQNGKDYDFAKTDFSSGKPVPLPIKVPVVCVPIKEHDDTCLQVNLPNTVSALKDAFVGLQSSQNQAMMEIFKAIQKNQTNRCSSQGDINFFVLMAWLFRGDDDISALENSFNLLVDQADGAADKQMGAEDKTKIKANLASMLGGLGLYPRNILNLMRTETLAQFLNQPADHEVSEDKVNAWEKGIDAEVHERTIQAYRSALSNLNSQVLNHSNVTMEELQSDRQITLAPVTKDFNTYVQRAMSQSGTDDNGENVVCKAFIFPFAAMSAPIGVTRTDTNTVHYAVRLKARANLLFLPMKDGIELEAVAAAKPFGSRIGPTNFNDDKLTVNIAPAVLRGVAINDCGGPANCNVPNLALNGGETFYSSAYLLALSNIASTNKIYSPAGITKAQTASLAPNPMEVGRYNILPPAKDSMGSEFIPYASSSASTIYRFYAPVTLASGGDANQRIDNYIDQMFAKTQAVTNSQGLNFEKTGQGIKATIHAYVSSKLDSTGGENGETLTFAALELPMPPGKVPNNAKYWLTNASQVLSSWGPNGRPRFGYSVKFVTLQNLIAGGMPAADDLEKVSH